MNKTYKSMKGIIVTMSDIIILNFNYGLMKTLSRQREVARINK